MKADINKHSKTSLKIFFFLNNIGNNNPNGENTNAFKNIWKYPSALGDCKSKGFRL